jgi:hypothetical protein
MLDEDSKAKSALYAGLFLFFIACGGHYLELEPIHNQFFAFSVWTYLLLADGVLYRLKGSSPLVTRTEEYFVLMLWSMFFGAFFELFNLRLALWQYVQQPDTLSTRWTGRLLSWASILPCLFITQELLQYMIPFRKLKIEPLTPDFSDELVMSAAGLIMLTLALAFPRAFSSLACCAFFFLAEPLNMRLGLPSLLRELRGGLSGKTFALMVSGVLCGLAWNFWNSCAGGKLEYLPPFDAWPTLFGFPVLGYPLFAFFGVEAYALCSLAAYPRSGRSWEEGTWTMPGKPPHVLLPLFTYCIIIITLYIALRATDACTVYSRLGWI